MFRRIIEWFCMLIHLLVTCAYVPIFTLPILLFSSYARFLFFMYLIHRILNRNIEFKGGIGPKLGLTSYFQQVCNYLQTSFVPLAEYPEGKNYMIVSHPHGIMAQSHGMTYPNPRRPGHEVFGKRPIFLGMTSNNLFMPIMREYYLAMGGVDVSLDSLTHVLGRTGKGRFLLIVPGGAREAFLNNDTIILNKRKGFIRLALTFGTWIIPAYSFGEVELYDVQKISEDGFLHKFREYLINNYGVVLPFVEGQAWYNLWMYLPRRGPLTVVMGKAIPVEKVKNPTPEQVNDLHSLYMSKIKELFENNKHKYLKNATERHLNII